MAKLNRQSILKNNSRKNPRPSTKGKKTQARFKKDPIQGLEVANPNAAAIDVGCAEHWVAVPPGREEQTVRSFGCFTADLEALADWLEHCQVDTVVMEATGNYWFVLYDLLEQRNLRPIVVNPRYAKNMSGKKGDIADCQWMQKLHTYGLFSNSFRPEQTVRALRTLMRQREMLVHAASRCTQHMQKALTEMNVQLANVISDITGETGLRIIDAILQGVRDPDQLAALRDPRIKASRKQLALALQGHWNPEQLFILDQARQSFTHYQQQMLVCAEQVQKVMRSMPSCDPQSSLSTEPAAPFELGEELRRILGVDLTAIDGVGAVTAQVFVSEVGAGVSSWKTENHFASWLGLSPEHRITGGKVIARSTRPVVSRLRNALRMAAFTLEHSHSALGAKYRRLKNRLGAPKAIVAMANHLAKLIYRMVKHGQEYVDKGMELYEKRFQAQRRRWVLKQAQALGLKLVEA